MKKKVLIIVLVIISAVGLGLGIFFISKHYASTSDGSITISVVDENNNVLKQKDIDFQKGDTLADLVKKNFNNVVIDNGMLMSIESISTPTDWSTYICIYVNGTASLVGILDIVFQDGDIISFVNTVYIPE
jgi:hypothetical protein